MFESMLQVSVAISCLKISPNPPSTNPSAVTMEPPFNEALYNEVLAGTMNDIRQL